MKLLGVNMEQGSLFLKNVATAPRTSNFAHFFFSESAQIWLINIWFKSNDSSALLFQDSGVHSRSRFERSMSLWIFGMVIILLCLANIKTLTSNDIIICRRTLTWHTAVRWANFRWNPQPLLFCVRGEGGTCDVDRLEFEVFIVPSRRGEKRAGLAEAYISHTLSLRF